MRRIPFLAGAAGLLYIGLGAMVYKNVTKPRTYSHEESKDFDIRQGSYTEEFIREIPMEEVRIPSTMGYDLYGHWIPYEDSKKTIILAHGITSNIYGAMKYYDLYREMGFNVLTYDHRNHGKSGGTETTMGYKEKHDLETCVQWVMDKVGEDSIIGSHGESMGGGTVIQHGAAYGSVDFIVADCPFADLSRELKDVSKREHKIPVWLALPAASLISKINGNGWYSETSPIRVIGDMETPLLIIHGDSDSYITPDHAQDLYDAKTKGIGRLYFAKDADHAVSIIKDRENYKQQVAAFLQEVL